MSDLLETFIRVQDLKTEAWEPPTELVDALAKGYRAQIGEEITAAQLLLTVQGVGWVLHMCQDHDLPFDELMGILGALEEEVRVNTKRAQRAGGNEDPVAMALGGGFFTGLWLGLELTS